MANQNPQTLPTFHIPQTHGMIFATTGQQGGRAVDRGTKGQTPDMRVVTTQLIQPLEQYIARLFRRRIHQLPEPNGRIAATTRQNFTIGAKGHRREAALRPQNV